MFQLLSAHKAFRTTGLSTITVLIGLTRSALAAPTVQAQDAPKPEPTYSVQRAYKAGEADHYKSTVNQTIDVNGNSVTFAITLLTKESTSSVTPEGTVTVEETYEQVNADINGMPNDLTSQFPKLILITDKKGHMEVKTEGGNDQIASQMAMVAKRMGSIQTLGLPLKPVKVGDTWSPDMSKVDAESGAKSTLTMKLEAVEILHGVKALKLKSVLDSSGGMDPSTKLHLEATMEVDAQTGKLIKMTSKTEGTMSGNKINSDTVMERSEPDEKKETKPASGDKKDPGTKADPGVKKDTGDKKP